MENTLGHSSVQGGLRGHSIGQDYPITVSYKGIIGKGHWLVWNVLTGKEIGYYKQSTEAHSMARWTRGRL